MSQYLDLAKKLKALSEQGVGGEKVNALVALQKVMRKYAIDPTQLETDKKEFFLIRWDKKYYKIFVQVLASITSLDIGVKTFRRSTLKNSSKAYFELTPIQHLELIAKYDFFEKLYKEELEILYMAFIHKHHLFPISPEEGKSSDLDMDKMQRIMGMMGNLKSESFKKQIE